MYILGSSLIFDSYSDPFVHPISYSPTDKETIDRGYAQAKRILTPHALVLQMLFSRLQAARYHRPSVMLIIQQLVLRSAKASRSFRSLLPSLHYTLADVPSVPMPSRGRSDSPSCFLGSRLSRVRTSTPIARIFFARACIWSPFRGFLSGLSTCIFSFSMQFPQFYARWSYGANRVQVEADVKVLSEFLTYLQTDSVRGPPSISSLAPARLASAGKS